LVMARLLNSRLGKSLYALRENEKAAQACGSILLILRFCRLLSAHFWGPGRCALCSL
jgi:ABC-type branched-subunit amino acid transport system permease subunit